MRHRSRAPLAIAAILAMPLFFASLMATSLAVEKPGVVHVLRKGRVVAVARDPVGSTEARIWLLAVLPSLVLVLVGTLAIRFGRVGTAVSAVSAIALAIALLVPLGTWAHRHSGRFPEGVDLIPASASGSQDIYLRGEWEANAKRAAEQLSGATIGIAAAGLVVLALLEVRRRRGAVPPPPPPPPAIADAVPGTGGTI